MSAKHSHRQLHSSILWKLSGSVLLCICLMMLFNWLLNNFVLVSYYQKAKEKSLIHAFTTVNVLSDEEISIGDTLYELSISQNISTVIWSPPNLLKYDYSPVKTNESRLLLSPPYGSLAQSPLLPGEYKLEVTDDTRLNSHFITLSGKLNNEDLILMRTSVASIEDSVGITNQFLLISGSISLLLGGLLTFWMARTFTRPIRALSRVAGSVARLDFSDHYNGRGSDELADLGNSINSMSESLERVISELRAANLRLEQDIRQKEKQNAAHRAFIANVSHELKTPIALIQNYAEGLREDIADGAENRDYYCEVIEDEAQKMSQLIRKMTSLMQLESGSEQLEPESFDVAELLDNLLQKNAPSFAKRDIHLAKAYSAPVTVWADPFLIEHVLNNYLSNALHHVPDGGTIECAIRNIPGQRVKLSVFNTGPALPEADIPHIWEIFYKSDKARTRAYGGNGIGLSVVAAIMQAHHMPYTVQNKAQTAYGSGVEFSIELSAVPYPLDLDSEGGEPHDGGILH